MATLIDTLDTDTSMSPKDTYGTKPRRRPSLIVVAAACALPILIWFGIYLTSGRVIWF